MPILSNEYVGVYHFYGFKNKLALYGIKIQFHRATFRGFLSTGKIVKISMFTERDILTTGVYLSRVTAQKLTNMT